MREPALVRDCVRAMVDAVGIDVTVKHRIGLEHDESYAFVRDFVGTVADAGCTVFIVHARNAWLKGLSPKENRERPPLRYDIVHRLKRDFPDLAFVLNGGIADARQIADALQHVDGAMLGREAYHHPWTLAEWDARFLGGADRATPERLDVERAMVAYMQREAAAHGTPWPSIARHMMGLWRGMPGARQWRQVWSDHRLKALPPQAVHERAQQALRQPAAQPA
jgi:tRNA-dihydrouridine synthase A